MSFRFWQYASALSGLIFIIISISALLACGFLPLIPPSWSAEETAQYYRIHQKGMRAGPGLIMLSSMFLLSLTTNMSTQLRRIPNLHYRIRTLQLVSGTAASAATLISGTDLATAIYRLDRPIELTQALSDNFFILYFLSWPATISQYFAIGHAITVDCRDKPLFPKRMAFATFIFLLLAVPPTVSGFIFLTGPLAWNGFVTFWMPVGYWIVLLSLYSFYLARAVSGGTCSNDSETA